MKYARLLPSEHVCLGSGFPCAYIYKKNRGLQRHQEKSDANAQHHPALRGCGSSLGSMGALVVFGNGVP